MDHTKVFSYITKVITMLILLANAFLVLSLNFPLANNAFAFNFLVIKLKSLYPSSTLKLKAGRLIGFCCL